MGSSDLFLTRKNKDGKFGTAVNLGYPINTSNNENSLIVNAEGSIAYYSSIRNGGLGMDDIYSFAMPKSIRPLPTSYFKGRVFDKNTNKGIEARFELTDLETGKLVAESYSNSGNGDFLVCLPTNKNYMMTISKNGYLFYSDNFQMKGEGVSVNDPYIKDVPLTPIKAGEKVILKNIFFSSGSFELKEESKNELLKLVSFLSKNSNLKIEISGHTDNVGAKDKNQILSENRAKSVVDFLLTQQIAATRLTYKGYGDTQPINENDTDEHRANNRRTEFKIVE
jgi:outer membrane protein OmpA-like peptidoglycan-associated protein